MKDHDHRPTKKPASSPRPDNQQFSRHRPSNPAKAGARYPARWENGIGKTTVLEAVRVYAARGRFPVLSEILQGREEVLLATDEDGDSVPDVDWAALFYGRDPHQHKPISIGPTKTDDQLWIKISPLTVEQSSRLARISPELLDDDHSQALKTVYRNYETITPGSIFPFSEPGTRLSPRNARSRLLHRDYRLLNESQPPPAIPCESLGPGLPDNSDMARFWDSVALTKYQGHAVQALRLIFGDDVDDVAMIGEASRSRLPGRRAIVKLKGHERPAPLRSLGEGALRIFGVALALANSRNGFLLIDEAENGIHYTLQSDFWRMVLRMAQENNVQVFATTHSWDCVRGFAQAATESEDVEGVLFRVERRGAELRAVMYSEKNLRIAAEQDIEVR